MSLGIAHIHHRNHPNDEQNKNDDKQLKSILIDRIAYPIALIGPITGLQQAVIIYKTKEVGSISVLLWVAFFITSIFWIYYGKKNRIGVILIGNIVWFIASTTILIEIFLYSH